MESVETGLFDAGLVVLHHRCGHRDHGNVPGLRIGSQLLTCLDAVHARQLNIHQHQRGLRFARDFDAFLGGFAFHGTVTFNLQDIPQHAAVLLVVLDDQDQFIAHCLLAVPALARRPQPNVPRFALAPAWVWRR